MRSFTLILFSVFCFSVAGQTSDDLKLIDEFDPRHDCETLESQLDLLFAEASNDSPSIAYAVIHQGNNAFDNALVHRKAINYARFRRFPADRYKVILTKGEGDVRVKLWIGKNGKTPKEVSSNLDVILHDGLSRKFAEDTVELAKLDGRDIYVDGGNPSCLYNFSPWIALELLKANSGFDIEFLIKTKSSKRYRLLVAILRKEFLEDGAPMGRIRFVYGGRDKENEGGGAKVASVTTSLVKSSQK